MSDRSESWPANGSVLLCASPWSAELDTFGPFADSGSTMLESAQTSRVGRQGSLVMLGLHCDNSRERFRISSIIQRCCLRLSGSGASSGEMDFHGLLMFQCWCRGLIGGCVARSDISPCFDGRLSRGAYCVASWFLLAFRWSLDRSLSSLGPYGSLLLGPVSRPRVFGDGMMSGISITAAVTVDTRR